MEGQYFFFHQNKEIYIYAFLRHYQNPNIIVYRQILGAILFLRTHEKI